MSTLYMYCHNECVECVCSAVLFCMFVDPDDPYKLTDDTRQLGLVVCRGTSVVLICPVDGMEAIANPFVSQET